jgi:flavin reductase (DIM6/NTAB) family NADH-FMN oxidoreductase RutF
VILDPGTISPGDFYRFMISVIVPRPIAFVSTMDVDGHLNVAPFSYYNAITNQPPLIGISITIAGGSPRTRIATSSKRKSSW